ncbi:hypothetical protein [Pseudomonas sp. W2-17]|uniref:hypothetical protein n=1 Tax=Pseudomonas sp. W2-17 TaxID=3058039 RepID=UPI0034E0AEE3
MNSSVTDAPVPESRWITIGAKNNAVEPGHWFYVFHIIPGEPDKPFCFEKSIGGGHAERGGAIRLSLLDLEDWPGDWRKHLLKAGCSWVADVIDNRLSDDVQDLMTAILNHCNS